MTRLPFIVLVAACVALSPLARRADGSDTRPFVRGDANDSGAIDISDAIFLLEFLFTGGEWPHCDGVGDANATGEVDLSDAITILSYLFSDPAPLSPMTVEEQEACQAIPRPVEVLRHGGFVTLQHGVTGLAEHLCDHTIRIRNFFYDGSGPPYVFVWLHKDQTTVRQGIPISPDLRRDEPYEGETIVFPIPDEISGDDFDLVSIWCTSIPTLYAHARMFR